MTVGKQILLTTLTKIIEQSPSHKRMAVLLALDLWRTSGERISELELVEAIVEGLTEEIARACYFPCHHQTSEYEQ